MAEHLGEPSSKTLLLEGVFSFGPALTFLLVLVVGTLSFKPSVLTRKRKQTPPKTKKRPEGFKHMALKRRRLARLSSHDASALHFYF